MPAELRRRAGDWVGWAMWGLWEVGRPEHAPGVVMTDLISGVRLYAEVPRVVLEGLPRWSVLFGYVLPVDGVWRAGPWFEVATPIEARTLVHELVDAVMSNSDGFGKEGRQMVAWARRVHDRAGELWMPAALEPPSAEAMAGLQLATRMFAPNLVAALREMQGRPVPQTGGLGWYILTLDDPDAAWTALAGQPGFELEDEELLWLGPEGEEPELDDDGEVMARASLERDDGGAIGVEIEADDLPGLLEGDGAAQRRRRGRDAHPVPRAPGGRPRAVGPGHERAPGGAGHPRGPGNKMTPTDRRLRRPDPALRPIPATSVRIPRGRGKLYSGPIFARKVWIFGVARLRPAAVGAAGGTGSQARRGLACGCPVIGGKL